MKQEYGSRALSAVVSFCAVILVVGCANSTVAEQTSGEDMLVDCADFAGGNTEVIQVKFSGNCPVVADPSVFEIKGLENKFVCWESVDTDGNRKKIKFEVIFDPFVGSPNKSDGNGRVRAKIFDKAPITTRGVEYKYTVWGVNCTGTDEEKYYDPRFTVRR